MKRYILLLIFSVNLFANNNDTKLILEMMKENNKNIIRVMQENNKNLENQIKAVKIDLENQIKAVKIDLENQIKAVKIDLENQIKATNRRIDDVNDRIDTLSNYVLGVFSSLIAVIGFIYWDRRTMISKAKEEIEKKMDNRYRAVINEVVETLKDLATVNPEIEKVVKRHNLNIV